MLAEVMGAYTLKARAFARIKLFNYTNRKVRLSVLLSYRVVIHVCVMSDLVIFGA